MKALLAIAALAALGVSVYLERVKIPAIRAEYKAQVKDLSQQLAEKEAENIALKKQPAEFERLLTEAEKKAPEPAPESVGRKGSSFREKKLDEIARSNRVVSPDN